MVCFHLEVDLLSYFPLDLARVSRKECQEALLPGVDHIDFVQRYLRDISHRAEIRGESGGGGQPVERQ